MHFQIHVEDPSGKAALETLVPKIVGNPHTCKIVSHQGRGNIPENIYARPDPKRRGLLDQLPALLRAYGKTYEGSEDVTVVVVCDLDDDCLSAFRTELQALIEATRPAPRTRFFFAVEEGEAWFLGDFQAVRKAYPGTKKVQYKQDSICGTWEFLANALGGRKHKSEWAAQIAPHMDVENNASPSFCYFRDKLRALVSAK